MEDRYKISDSQTVKGKWPLCELRAVYKCQLCETDHVAIARARGVNMTSDLAKEFLKMVKVDLVNKFFQEHPKAKVEEFVIGLVSAVEYITYEEGGDTDKDSIGIPWIVNDIEALTGRKATPKEGEEEMKEPAKIEEKEAPGKLKAEDKSPLKDLEKMDFADLSADGMEKIFRKKLKEVKEREEQLKVEIMLLAHERVKYETMITAIEAVEKQKKEDAKSE